MRLHSRKSSVKRHIHNLHHDGSTMVKYIDYLAGRHSGIYGSASMPHYDEKSYFDHITDICNEEYLRESSDTSTKTLQVVPRP